MATYHRGDLADQITAACLADIREHGELTLSIRKLSAKLGVSHNALYHHFRDKNALIGHLVAQGFKRLKGSLDGGDATESLANFGLRYFRFFRDEPKLYRFMFAHVAGNREGQPRATFEQLVRRVGGSKNAAYHHWALIHGLCTLISANALAEAKLGDEDIEHKVRAILAAGVGRS